MPPFTLIQSRPVHRGRVFELYSDRVVLSDGTAVDMDVIRHPGAAAIVPVNADGRLLLLRQYRYAVNREIWEIPAGTLEPGEAPLDCARRELEEEAGVVAGAWYPLGTITSLPGYSDEQIYLFMAGELSQTLQNPDPDEFLSVHEISREDAMAMIYRGDIQDAKTVAGLFMAENRLKEQNG